MLNLRRRLKVMKGRSAREIGVRGIQQFLILRERVAREFGREMTDSEFLSQVCESAEALSSRRNSIEERCASLAYAALQRLRRRPIFNSLLDKDALDNEMRVRYSAQRLELIHRADRAIEGQFSIFGSDGVRFGSPTDWMLDPQTGKRAPGVHWSTIEYLNPSVAGEKKNIWELNRHSHFITFGQAYVMTGDERYVRALADQMNSWMDTNPPELGINWCSSLELALRSIAWIWAMSLVAGSSNLHPCFVLRVMKCLIAHGQHIESYLSTYFSPNTHLTGEALGLLYLGLALPECRSSFRWKQKALKILLEQLRLQVRGDGVYFEQSSYYHRYTTDFYFNLLILAHQNNINLEKELSPVLSQMAEYLCRTMRPDGTVLLIGDDDGGKLLSLSCRDPYDFRDSLALASALFGKPEWKYVAGADVPELLWLIGPDGHSRYSQLKAQRPLDYFRAFEESGQYFGRTGWGETSSWLFFRCGPPAALSGAHEHADQLSFEFFADGVPWLVDPGTYTYTLDETARNEFRLSGAHNTLIVDSQPQSSPKGPFSWNERAGGKAGRVFANPQLTYIEGVHDGYQSLDPPVDHHRSLLLVRRDEDSSFEMPDYLIAHDRLKTDGDHGYSLAYHFGPEVDAEADSTGFRARHSLGNSLLIRHRSTMDFRASVCASFLSERYGHRRESRLGLLHASGRGEHEISTIILPVSADAPFQPCVSIPCESTGSIRVRSQKTQDWIQFGSGVLNVGEWSVSASSSILWIRRSSSGLLRVAMVGANALAIDGLFELRLAAADGIVLCELHGDQLSLSFGPTTEVDLSVAGNLRRVISASDCMEVTAGSGLRHVKGVWTVFRRD